MFFFKYFCILHQKSILNLKDIKKVILFAAVLMVTCLISCNVTPPGVIRADFMYALLIMSVVKVQLIMSILIRYMNHMVNIYRIQMNFVFDSLTAIFEKM